LSGVQVPNGFVLEEGAVGYLCVEVYFATRYMHMYVGVVSAIDVLPMLHVYMNNYTPEDAKAISIATLNITYM
jgi:cytochrome b subunit of formate dehydrogenase